MLSNNKVFRNVEVVGHEEFLSSNDLFKSRYAQKYFQ